MKKYIIPILASCILLLAATNIGGVTKLFVSQGGTSTTTMAVGGILFYDGTSVTQDTTVLFWDDTNNRLGIGTSTPSALFSVGSGTGLQINNSGQVVKGTWMGTAIGDAYLTKSGDWTGTLDNIEGAAFLTEDEFFTTTTWDGGNLSIPSGSTFKIGGTDLACSNITNCVANAWDALTDMVLTNTYIYVGNASNDPVGVDMTGDCTITNLGVIECTQADALESNPTDCSQAGSYAKGIYETGSSTCAFIADADVPNDITIDTATALATNPTACTNQFVRDLDADGTLTCATVDISSDTNLTVTATGIEMSLDAIAMTSGYNIPLTASTTDWNLTHQWYDTYNSYIDQDVTSGASPNFLTTNISEGTNLWFTNQRVDDVINASSSIPHKSCASGEILEYSTANNIWECGTDNTTAGPGSNWKYYGTSTIIPTSTVGVIVSATSTFSDDFSAGKTTRLFVDADGYIGIATSSPTHALEVAGDIYFTGDLETRNARKIISDPAHRGNISSTTLGIYGAYDESGTTTVYFDGSFYAETWTHVHCETDTGTVVIKFGDGTDYMEYIKCDSDGEADDGSLTNNTFTQWETIELQVGSQSGNPNQIYWTVHISTDN